MRAVLFRSLLVIGAGGLVLAGLLYLASTVDARPPEILDITLTGAVAGDATVAPITTAIEIAFSEPVETDGAAAAISLDPPVEGTLTRSGSLLIFTPAEPLELDTAYTLTIATGIRDLSGNEMTEAPPPFEFTTTGRPVLADSDPVDGAEDVAVDSVVTLVFSSLMDIASVEAALELEPAFEHELRWSEERLEIVPAAPLEPGSEYAVRIGDGATDNDGVALDAPISIGFRTVEAGLSIEQLVPAHRSGGISPRTRIAVAFDRAIDPESLDEAPLTVTPEIPGTLQLMGTAEDPDSDRLLVFTPSGPLPPNTTFDVQLAAGVAATAGDSLAEPVAWTFTTGAPPATLSNQVLFISDRSGIANVWAMNPDGTGQHQVSAELTPIIDYAAAPNGSSLVVGDGRRLVYLRADGSERRSLTDAAHLEFDPTYAPGGVRIAYARADAASGELLGLWQWELEGGAPTAIELPAPTEPGASPGSPAGSPPPATLRAPSFAPEGGALAFVDAATGAVGILDLAEDRLTMVEVVAAGTPSWSVDGDSMLVATGDAPAGAGVSAPVGRLRPDAPFTVAHIARDGSDAEPIGLPSDINRLATDATGRVGWIDADGIGHIAGAIDETGTVPAGLEGLRISELAFGPDEDVVLVVIGGEDSTLTRVERVELESGERSSLARDGRQVRWLP